jgi:hypothetical protein
MSDWQPIETAPRDGTSVLLVSGPPVQNRIVLTSWVGAPHNHWRAEPFGRFTHWMPLPDPPSP